MSNLTKVNIRKVAVRGKSRRACCRLCGAAGRRERQPGRWRGGRRNGAWSLLPTRPRRVASRRRHRCVIPCRVDRTPGGPRPRAPAAAAVTKPTAQPFSRWREKGWDEAGAALAACGRWPWAVCANLVLWAAAVTRLGILPRQVTRTGTSMCWRDFALRLAAGKSVAGTLSILGCRRHWRSRAGGRRGH